MRLRDTLGLLTYVQWLTYKEEQVLGANPQAFILTTKERIVQALGLISRVEPLAAEARRLLGMPMIKAPSVGAAERNDFRKALDDIINRVSMLETLIRGVLPPQSPETIAIRIPEPENLEELKGTLSSLYLVFQDPVKRFFGGKAPTLGFQNFDTGSSWIELAGYSGVVLKFTFALLWASNAYRSGAAKAQQEEARATAMGAAADVIKVMADAQIKIQQAHLEQLTGQIVNGYEAHRDPGCNVNEASNSIRKAVEVWSDLLDRGATVRPALNAPKDLREEFPESDVEDFAQLTAKLTKLLKAGEDDPPA